MGVTKKATVVAKTATKKRGRPVGSKNKTTKTMSSTGWVPPQPVDWEKLAKRLQEALATEMKLSESYKGLLEEFTESSAKVKDLSLWQRITLVFTGKI
jgi:hypothetical protein